MIAGIQLSSIKARMQTVEDVQTSLARLASVGYRYVQLQWHGRDVPVNALADALSANGMTAVSVQDYVWEIRRDPEYYISLAEACGFTDICASGIPEELTTMKGIPEFVEQYALLGELLLSHGLSLSFHPRWMEYREVGSAPAAGWLLAALPKLRVVLDYHHVLRAGVEPLSFTGALTGRIDFIHCKDTAADGKTLVPVGSGTVDWQPLLRSAEAAGARIAFVEQESWTGDPFACMERSLQYLLSLGLTSS